MSSGRAFVYFRKTNATRTIDPVRTDVQKSLFASAKKSVVGIKTIRIRVAIVGFQRTFVDQTNSGHAMRRKIRRTLANEKSAAVRQTFLALPGVARVRTSRATNPRRTANVVQRISLSSQRTSANSLAIRLFDANFAQFLPATALGVD